MIGILFANSAFSQCPPTSPTITGTPVLCDGASGYLSASGSGDTYTWTPGGANTASISISPTATATYSVLMGQTGCTLTSAAVITVTVAKTPTVLVTGAGSTVAATSFTTCGSNAQYPFRASGASSYTWSTGVNTATTSVYVPYGFGQPPYTNTYTVTGQNACGTSTTVVSLSVYSYPTSTISASKSPICPGESVVLTPTSTATNYAWRKSGSATIIATTPTIVVSPTVTTTYRLELSSSVYCLRYDQITVNVNPCTGTEEMAMAADVKVYPNPVTERLYIDILSDAEPRILEVSDVTGKIVIREMVSGPGNAIPTNRLQPGLYFYRLAGKTGKLVKQ